MPGKVVSQEEWLTARKELLVKEKAATRAIDALTKERQSLPMVKLDKTYIFEGPEGKVTLADLFNGRKQLLVYHFMFGPDAEVGCEGCSFMVDQFPSELSHLHSRTTNLILVSRAPIANIQKFKTRMGWTLPWYSSFSSPFNYDFQATLDPAITPPVWNFKDAPDSKGEMPGISVFYKDGEEIFHTYSAYGRGLELLMVTPNLLDLTPLGRQDDPAKGDFKRHDEYTEEEIGKA